MKRGKGIKLKINLTNRWKYSLIVGTFIVVVLSLAFLGQSIFAAAGSECVVNGGKCILYSYSCGDLSGGYVDAALDCGSRSEKCCKPTVRHNSSQILINVDGVETNLQTAWDQRETNLVCTTGVLNSNTPPYNVKAYMPSNTPLVGGYYESINYDNYGEVVEQAGPRAIRCRQENGWVLTGCSSDANSDIYGDPLDVDESESFNANTCMMSTNNLGFQLSVRCCKFEIK